MSDLSAALNLLAVACAGLAFALHSPVGQRVLVGVLGGETMAVDAGVAARPSVPRLEGVTRPLDSTLTVVERLERHRHIVFGAASGENDERETS